MAAAQPLTTSARNALLLAEERARGQGSRTVRSEHLLSAILETNELPARTLGALGVDPAAVRDRVRSLRADDDDPDPSQRLGSDTRRVLECASREARTSGKDAIGTEDLLVGILDAGQGAGFEALQSLGVTASAVRSAIAGP